MVSRQSTVDFIVEQMAAAGDVSAKKMFGEYAIYCDGKLVALVCDGQLYIKPTISGRSFIRNCVEAPPYKGAKPSLLISGDQIEDAQWLSKLVGISAAELPQPKKNKRRKRKD
ncbi:MAG TPA: TfoX/Sxy family protein [Geobacterales bacterium]|nr:TfoX/Sxy family protein [Geobacterales bacterium]